MYLNRWTMTISFMIGIFGIWGTLQAFTQYTESARSFTEVSIDYIPGSFRWNDAEYRSAELQLSFNNESHSFVTVNSIVLRLYFDGEFAGARYRPWDPVVILEGTSQQFIEQLTVSMSAIRPEGGTAFLEIRGRLTLSLNGIDRPATVPIEEIIGQVPYVAD